MTQAISADSVTDLPHVWRPSPGGDVAGNRTILLLHGTGADEHDLIGLGKALDPNANLLSPRGQVRAELPPYGDGMIRWFMRHEDGTFDEDGIRMACGQLSTFVEWASGQYGFDLSNVWVAGFSNGANASGALLLLHPKLIRGVMAFGTTKSFIDTEVACGGLPDLNGKHVWICNGALDGYSPAERTASMVAEFESLGATVSLRVHGGGHTISHEHVREVADELASIG